MNILFVVGEVAGIHKTGGLGDVALELPLALIENNINIQIVMPRFASIKIPDGWTHEYSGDVIFASQKLVFKIITGTHPVYTNLKIHLIEELTYVSSTQYDDAKRYGVFNMCIVTWLKMTKPNFQIIHNHDWHTGLIPLMIKRDHLNLLSVFTIHNLLYQGITPSVLAYDLNLPTSWSNINWDIQNGDMNFLMQGIMYCDKLTTVSPQYAQEIQESTHGGGLESILKENSHKLVGILNGISWSNWNPETDNTLPFKYSKHNYVQGKLSAKKLLFQKLNMDTPQVLMGYVGRADRKQKGIPLILDLVSNHWNYEWKLVMLAQGEPDLEQEMRQVEARFPDRLTVINRFDEELARLIYASSDLMLIPSYYEPCGLVQLIAMRYGAIPIVRRTGGLADTVFENINGFLFENFSIQDFTISVYKAVEIWQKEVDRLVISAMSFDSSWDKSAKEYIKMYQKLLNYR